MVNVVYMAPLVAAVLVVLAALVNTTFTPRYAWFVTVYPPSSPLASAIPANSAFAFSVSITDTLDQSTCVSCSRDLHFAGGHPLITVNTPIIKSAVNLSDSVVIRHAFSPISGTWTIPFLAASDPGHVNLVLNANRFVPFYLAQSKFDRPHTFTFKVSLPYSIFPRGSAVTPLGTLAPITSLGSPSNPTLASINDNTGILGNNLIISSDHWWTSAMLVPNWPSEIAALPSICNSSPGRRVYDARECGGKRTYFATTWGLIEYNNESGTMVLLLTECVTKLIAPSRVDPITETCPLMLTYLNSKLWFINTMTGHTTLVRSMNGQTLPEYLGTEQIEIVSADFSNKHCRDIAILLKRDSLFCLATLTMQHWVVRFKFSATIPYDTLHRGTTLRLFNDSSSFQQSPNPTTTLLGTRPIELSGLAYSRIPSSDLYVFGSTLMYSPDDGKSIFLLDNPPDNRAINQFVNSPTSNGYIYLTSDRSIYAGLVSTPAAVFMGTASASVVSVDFDANGQPHTLSWTASGLVRSNINWSNLWDSSVLSESMRARSVCPYASIRVQGSMSSVFTRTLKSAILFNPLLHSIFAATVHVKIPRAIYLDYRSSYSFTVSVTPTGFDQPLTTLVISVLASDQNLLQVVTQREEVISDHRVIYTVTLKERGLFASQNAPGEGLIAIPVKISVMNGYACPISSIGPLTVYIGCPPFQQLILNPDTNQQCINPDKSVPCVNMDLDYKPTFSIMDLVDGRQRLYNESITLSLIAGGPTSTSNVVITPYLAETISQINQLTWAPNSDNYLPKLEDGRYVHPNAQAINMSWACLSGSPCSSIIPEFPNPAEYYFHVHASTANVTQGVSYCRLQVTYPLRLYGLAVDLTTSVLATGTTLIVALVLIVARALWQRYQQTQSLLKVNPMVEVSKTALITSKSDPGKRSRNTPKFV